MKSSLFTEPRVVLALDFHDKKTALQLVDSLNPSQCALKVGKEMFTHFGPAFVEDLVKKDFRVFLDLKFHDIPNTVANACVAAADLGVWMINLHSLGGRKMMEAAGNALANYGRHKPLLLAVTVLTSMDKEDLEELGITEKVDELVVRLAKLSKSSGLDGVVASPREIQTLRQHCGEDFCLLTPGIRPVDSDTHDQKRTMTPKAALDAGADYIVIGRPITQSKNPLKELEKILVDIM